MESAWTAVLQSGRAIELTRLSSAGALWVWSVRVKDGVVVSSWGMQGGKMQEGRRPISAKNVGRSNERSAEIAAVDFAISKIKKKHDEGYGGQAGQSRGLSSNAPSCMLAKKWGPGALQKFSSQESG